MIAQKIADEFYQLTLEKVLEYGFVMLPTNGESFAIDKLKEYLKSITNKIKELESNNINNVQ